MSAWIVSKAHIDTLVGGHAYPVSAQSSKIGRMLWLENWKSVTYRYGDVEDLPGPINFSLADIDDYIYEPRRPRSLVELFKAISCYVYQSCEHDGWETSEARQYCDALKDDLIGRLPGYDDAEWEIED